MKSAYLWTHAHWTQAAFYIHRPVFINKTKVFIKGNQNARLRRVCKSEFFSRFRYTQNSTIHFFRLNKTLTCFRIFGRYSIISDDKAFELCSHIMSVLCIERFDCILFSATSRLQSNTIQRKLRTIYGFVLFWFMSPGEEFRLFVKENIKGIVITHFPKVPDIDEWVLPIWTSSDIKVAAMFPKCSGVFWTCIDHRALRFDLYSIRKEWEKSIIRSLKIQLGYIGMVEHITNLQKRMDNFFLSQLSRWRWGTGGTVNWRLKQRKQRRMW